jgi:ankyrin repeat protein
MRRQLSDNENDFESSFVNFEFVCKQQELERQQIKKQIQEVLNGGENFIVNNWNETVLHYAYFLHDEEVLKILVKKSGEAGILNHFSTYEGRSGTALVRLVQGGYSKLVDLLLDAGAEVKINYGIGETALRFLNRIDSPSVKEKLIQKYAKASMLDNKDLGGETALIRSIFFENGGWIRSDLTAAKLLLKYGAKCKMTKGLFNTYIDGHKISEEVIKELSLDKFEMTELPHAQKYFNNDDYELLIEAAQENKIGEMKDLLEAGLDVSLKEYKEKWEDTILYYILRVNDRGVLKILVDQCVKAKVIDNCSVLKHSALYQAVCFKNETLIEFLLEAGAEASQSFPFGIIYIVDEIKNLLLREKLIQRCAEGGTLNLEDVYGNTALTRAISSNDQETVKLLLKYGAEFELYSKSGILYINKTPIIDKKIIELVAKHQLQSYSAMVKVLHKFLRKCLEQKDPEFEDLLWQKDVIERCAEGGILDGEWEGETPLSLVLKGKNEFLIGLLLNHDVVIRPEDISLASPIKNPTIREIFVEMCIEQDVDVSRAGFSVSSSGEEDSDESSE